MASLDALGHPLIEILQLAFADLIERGDVDVVVMPEANEFEVQGDDWTLHLEGWPVNVAWIALDETPVSHGEQMAALDATLGSAEMAALRDADRQLQGRLTDGLADSGDGLSQALALVLGDGSDPGGDLTGDSQGDDQESDEAG